MKSLGGIRQYFLDSGLYFPIRTLCYMCFRLGAVVGKEMTGQIFIASSKQIYFSVELRWSQKWFIYSEGNTNLLHPQEQLRGTNSCNFDLWIFKWPTLWVASDNSSFPSRGSATIRVSENPTSLGLVALNYTFRKDPVAQLAYPVF